MRKLSILFMCVFLLAGALLACGESSAPSSSVTQASSKVVTASPTKPLKWDTGAVITFHSTDYQGVGGYSESFKVPALWRLYWFCFNSGDPANNFFSIDVQHAGDMSNADGENPVSNLSCGSPGNGTAIETIGGNVTLQILAASGVKWDVYVQTPK